MAAGNRHADAGKFSAAKHDAEYRDGIPPKNLSGLPVAVWREAEGLDRAERLRDVLLQVEALAPDQNAPAARDQVHQPAKLQGDRSQVGKDVRMVKFERREDELVGMVVEEFRRLVEEGGVIFVSFDDELVPATKAVAAVAEIGDDPANQKIGTTASDVENPGEHGRSGRLAVCAGHDDRCVAGNEIFLE